MASTIKLPEIPALKTGDSLFYQANGNVFVRYVIESETPKYWLVGREKLRVRKHCTPYHSSAWGLAYFLTASQLSEGAKIIEEFETNLECPRVLSADYQSYERACTKARNEIKKLINSTGNLQILEEVLQITKEKYKASHGHV